MDLRRVLVTGSTGMVGSALMRLLAEVSDCDVLGCSTKDFDMRSFSQTMDFFSHYRPHTVLHAAALVGGILANDARPVDYFDDNIRIQSNVLKAANHFGCERLIFLGSSCTYPRDASQPMHEEQLWTGHLEATNRAFAAAKLAGYAAVEAYQRQYKRDWSVVLLTSLYGPGDNFDHATSHVLPALLRKLHEAKEQSTDVLLWGSGQVRREFMYVDDAARAIIHLSRAANLSQPINVGVGQDVSIADLAKLVAEIVGFQGSIIWDASKPDGTPRKLLDVSRLTARGFAPKVSLVEGVRRTYQWMLSDEAREPRLERDLDEEPVDSC